MKNIIIVRHGQSEANVNLKGGLSEEGMLCVQLFDNILNNIVIFYMQPIVDIFLRTLVSFSCFCTQSCDKKAPTSQSQLKSF